jgi:hypothetical protein
MMIAYIACVFTRRTMMQADLYPYPDAPLTHSSKISIIFDCIVHPPQIPAFGHGIIASYTTNIKK